MEQRTDIFTHWRFTLPIWAGLAALLFVEASRRGTWGRFGHLRFTIDLWEGMACSALVSFALVCIAAPLWVNFGQLRRLFRPTRARVLTWLAVLAFMPVVGTVLFAYSPVVLFGWHVWGLSENGFTRSEIVQICTTLFFGALFFYGIACLLTAALGRWWVRVPGLIAVGAGSWSFWLLLDAGITLEPVSLR